MLCFILAWNNKSKTESAASPTKLIRSEMGCYLPFELNPLGNNDTINRMCYEGTKAGHWIVFQWIIPNGKQPLGAAVSPVRAKLEEGYYLSNKKEGFWKFYKTDGTLRDSIEFKNDEPSGC
jgi:hypothetical protein